MDLSPSAGRTTAAVLRLGALLLALGASICFFASGCRFVERETTITPSREDAFVSLDDLVQQRVGDFTLVLHAQESSPPVGAADQRELTYGSPVLSPTAVHSLYLFHSADQASGYAQKMVEIVSQRGYSSVSDFPVVKNGSEGQHGGEGVLLAREGEPQAEGQEQLIWSNKNLACVLITPTGYAYDFYQDLSY